jgi:hypothetical protein
MISLAYHEAGHAVALIVQGLEFTECSINIVGENGRVQIPAFDPAGADANELKKYAVSCLAGWEAQLRHEPDLNLDLYKNTIERDLMNARSLIGHISASDEDRQAIFDQCKHMARSMIEENWAKIEKLARALQERHRLTGYEISALIG